MVGQWKIFKMRVYEVARCSIRQHLVIAQLVERWTVAVYINPSVTGSIPVREIFLFW